MSFSEKIHNGRKIQNFNKWNETPDKLHFGWNHPLRPWFDRGFGKICGVPNEWWTYEVIFEEGGPVVD